MDHFHKYLDTLKHTYTHACARKHSHKQQLTSIIYRIKYCQNVTHVSCNIYNTHNRTQEHNATCTHTLSANAKYDA